MSCAKNAQITEEAADDKITGNQTKKKDSELAGPRRRPAWTTQGVACVVEGQDMSSADHGIGH